MKNKGHAKNQDDRNRERHLLRQSKKNSRRLQNIIVAGFMAKVHKTY